jgi:hypothetical protein
MEVPGCPSPVLPAVLQGRNVRHCRQVQPFFHLDGASTRRFLLELLFFGGVQHRSRRGLIVYLRNTHSCCVIVLSVLFQASPCKVVATLVARSKW